MTSPTKLGPYLLSNRIVSASRPRLQAENYLLQAESVFYYSCRASCGLIITEPTLVSAVNTLTKHPGIFTRQQLYAWREIAGNIREQGGKIFLQLWYGQTIDTKTSLNQVEIVSLFRRSAQNALTADFDGVEVNVDLNYANLHDLDCTSALDNKVSLLLNIVEEVASVWDENRVGIKLTLNSAWLEKSANGLSSDFYYFLDALNFYGIAYLHLAEPIIGNTSQTEMLANWLNLFNSLYSGLLMFNCQDDSAIIKDIIVGKNIKLISFKDLSAIFV